MKKSYKTYLLLAVVVGIWGIIGYKIVSTINPVPEEDRKIALNEKFVPKKSKERDTFSISANYRDPFLGTMPKSLEKKRKRAIVKDTLPEKQISYTGLIMGNSAKKKIFFLTIDGEQQMMSIKDTFKNVKLVSGDKNAVRVKYNGKSKTIALTQ